MRHTISRVIEHALSDKNRNYEPTMRMCGGSFRWVSHRFPIKGGITFADVVTANLVATNPLFRELVGSAE